MGLEIQKPTVSKICVAVTEPVPTSTGVVGFGDGLVDSQVYVSLPADVHHALSESHIHIENKVDRTSSTKDDRREGASRAAQDATPNKQIEKDTHTHELSLGPSS